LNKLHCPALVKEGVTRKKGKGMESSVFVQGRGRCAAGGKKRKGKKKTQARASFDKVVKHDFDGESRTHQLQMS